MNIPINNEQMSIIALLQDNPELLSNYRRFASVIGDCFPNNKPLKNALINAYSEGIFEILQEDGDMNQIFFRCKNKLEKNCGIISKYAIDAVIVAAYICNKTEYLDLYGKENEEVTAEVGEEKKIVNYKSGSIEYVRYRNGVALTNIEFVDDGLKGSSVAIVIPEVIDGYEVLGLLPNSLNRLRFNKVRMIICPNSLRFVGGETQKLYEEFKEKGTYSKPKLLYAKKRYEEYAYESAFIKGFLSFTNEEFYGFEVLLEKLENGEFLLLNKYQDKNDFWMYPTDGMWISKGVLDCYLGTAESLKVNTCHQISSKAFQNLHIEELIFGEQVEIFDSLMIRNCHKLKRIVFEAKSRCRFGENAISYCDSLEDIQWPKIMNFEELSIYNHCPKLGNMVVYNRLLTCQDNVEVLVLSDELVRVNNYAFISCDKTRILVVPESVDVFEHNALCGSNIEIVIFLGRYTQWKMHHHCDKKLYVYTREGSSIMHSASPFTMDDLICMKNISILEDCLIPVMDSNKIKEMCYRNMDGCNDEEMIPKPYGWEREIWEKR